MEPEADYLVPLGRQHDLASRAQRGPVPRPGRGLRPEDSTSTVLVSNIQELEGLAGQITPPVWPFAGIDETKKKQGRTLFEAHCLKCHKDLKEGGKVGDDLYDVGTDPLHPRTLPGP